MNPLLVFFLTPSLISYENRDEDIVTNVGVDLNEDVNDYSHKIT